MANQPYYPNLEGDQLTWLTNSAPMRSPLTLLPFARRILLLITAAFLASARLQAATVTPAISAGEEHSLFLRKDGTVWAAGDNFRGQLGDGTTNNHYSTRVQVMSGVQAISAGRRHSLFLKTDGSVWAAGDNSSG